MKIIREPLCPRNGRRVVVARYSNITTQTAHDFMVMAAKAEADRRNDIKSVAVTPDSLSGRSTATLMDKRGRSVVRFVQAYPKG